jgi:hypothetical protein
MLSNSTHFEVPKHLAVMPEQPALNFVAYDDRFGQDRRNRGRRLLRVLNRLIQARRVARPERDMRFGRPDLIENDYYRFLKNPAVNSAG